MAYLVELPKCRCGKPGRYILKNRFNAELGARCSRCAPRSLADQQAIEKSQDGQEAARRRQEAVQATIQHSRQPA